ncbi:hypothetical protein OVY48_10325 [Sphingobium sp. SA2]|uniref:hypothetical protein n=1 Tax=Sphingobium sp. SA2 TaxID=1524832 RepID=UPI0028C05A08|nr:hypothetical protein [Sphingobium sp. SA2]MDT7533819.1 hypothetical protein [Sphingobium sp. SA2]
MPVMRASHILLPFGLLISAPALAQTPADVADLVGAKGAGGETQLKARGYRFVRIETGDDRKWTFWWNGDRRQCLSVVTYDGRYQAITESPAPDCGESARAPSGHGGAPHRPDIGYARPRPDRVAPSYAADDSAQTNDRVQLGLVCFGDGQRPGVANSYGWTWDSDKKRYRYGNRVEMTAEQFDASVMIQFWEGGGHIKLPKKLIPPLHSRGTEDGWWDIYNVSMQPDRITGEYRLNGLNKPRIDINRTSGQISIKGLADYAFRGTCDTADAAAHRRF